mmetsp:Transcript_3883/g.5534  ORF Transcript_3883/g.5534 Transcript_3883/m.5534 type:complete len:99 (+) Transcript_3883:340-636(+)
MPITGHLKTRTKKKPRRNIPVPTSRSRDPKNSLIVLEKPMSEQIPETNKTFPRTRRDVSKRNMTPKNMKTTPNTVRPMPILRSLLNIFRKNEQASLAQ